MCVDKIQDDDNIRIDVQFVCYMPPVMDLQLYNIYSPRNTTLILF